MIKIPKYYCPKCKGFRTKKEVAKSSHISCWGYPFERTLCTWCHRPVIGSIKALENVMEDYYKWQEKQKPTGKDLFVEVELIPHK